MVLAVLVISTRVMGFRSRLLRPLAASMSHSTTLSLRSTINEPKIENLIQDEGEEGDIVGIKVTQKKYKVDEEAVRRHIRNIAHILGVEDFKVDVWYCSESKMRDLNDEWRDKRKSTDVLSFPANEFIRPGVFDNSDPTLQYMKHLGDIVVAPAYVHRQCERDRSFHERDGAFDDDEDAGVSKAMAREFSLEKRIDLLLVHSMVHLLGYDHETPEEWREMTKKEEEVISALREREMK